MERKERFELSKRVWKTRMFPATSLPHEVGTPGRIRTHNLDVRSVALIQLSYRSIMNFGLRISDCGFENRGEQPVMIDFRLRFKSAIRNSKSEIWGGASYRIRTGVSALATPCLEPTGPTMQRNFGLVGEDRIELSPRVPRTRMLALHHTPFKFQVSSSKSQVQETKIWNLKLET